MSIFTNPASRSADQAEEYARAVLDLLGPREPLVVLEATPDLLSDVVAGMSGTQLAVPERDGKWSIRHVLRHLADSEIVWAFRLRMVLAQERPTVTGYDQDAWAERLAYADARPTESLTEFTVLRRSNLKLLRRTSDADRQRIALHAERGDETLERMTRVYAGHDLVHLRQIERIRAAVTG